jgi:pyruvate,orthophosphate dikinase
MSKELYSQALEANLNQTQEITSEIPEIQQWFGELSKSKWGVYKRTKGFLIELNHKYRNNQYVIESLHNICLEDLWFYNSLDESEKALSVLVDIFRELSLSNLKEDQRELLMLNIIKFIDRLANLHGFPMKIVFDCLQILKDEMEKYELLFIRNSGYFKTYLSKIAQLPEFEPLVIEMTSQLLAKCIDYWENTSLAEEWFHSNKQLFRLMDETMIKVSLGKPFFSRLRIDLAQATDWESLRRVMFYNDISNHFRSFTKQFSSRLEEIYYLYYLLHLPTMSNLYNHLLYDLNRNLRSVLKELNTEEIPAFLDNVMAELKALKNNHSSMVLDCLLTLGKEVINTRDQGLLSHFLKNLIKLGFNFPGPLRLSRDWQIRVNTNHVKNIRVWLELIEQDPLALRELITALIVNLKLGGIFISDTDLFQREITKLLNSDIGPVYREIKQLARIFPVYFRDIGAEGRLREITTALDEQTRRKDKLIHFLRKQIHTESNNTHLELTKKIISYWLTGDKEPLKGFIPRDIFRNLNTDEERFIRVHKVLTYLYQKTKFDLEKPATIDLKSLKETLETLPLKTSAQDKTRVLYIFEIYLLLLEKYSLETENIISLLKNHNFFSASELEILKTNLENGRCEDSINQIYKLMHRLRKIILNPEKSEPLEDIYYKRHIAAGIPSIYGRYIEPKFEALGLMYRLERTVSKLMTQILLSFNFEYITAKTFRQVYEILSLFKEGLELDGICNQEFNSHLEILKYSLVSPSISLDQYINIFQFMAQDIKQIIREYFFEVYEKPLKIIIPEILASQNFRDEDEKRQTLQMESEKFLRDNLASAFLVQELDNFITDLINTLRTMADNYSVSCIEKMLTYDPDLTFSPLTQKTEKVDNPVFLGAKAFSLKKLFTAGFPVPPGFVLTTEVFRHLKTINSHPYMRQDLDRMIVQNITALERITGQKYGRPEKPLFFSVRSGSLISLPGAMKTLLNVGINKEIAEISSQKEGLGWAAWDCYRRFLRSWGMAFGIERHVFNQVMQEHKERYGVEHKIQFTPEQMKEISLSYKRVLEDYNIKIETDPFKQLKQAIQCVFDSWSSSNAVYYRDHMQIANEWGTAVLVQKMILGNLSTNSGTGVVFTSNPFNNCSDFNLYGDFVLGCQGEDVVSGLVDTLPISEYQRKNCYRDCGLSLESAFPQIYKTLVSYAKRLVEEHGFGHQEIEFTFESAHPRSLYILQTRNQNLKKEKPYARFVRPPNEMKLVGHGIGVSGGPLTGLLAFDMEDIKRLRKERPEARIILVCPDTVPDDIPLILLCDALITNKGGITSHAAVTAANLGKVCIVKCRRLKIKEFKKECTINGHVFGPGDELSIDGSLGNIYEGCYEISNF